MTTGFVMGKNKTVLTMKYVLFILLALILAACRSEKDRRLEYALEFAGDNRVELEKVLEHYRTDPEKLEAARFLIRNRSEERRVGKECSEPCRSRWSPYH